MKKRFAGMMTFILLILAVCTLGEGMADIPETEAMDPEREHAFLETAKARFWLAGYTVDDDMTGSAEIEGSDEDATIHIVFRKEDGSAEWQYFTDAIGRILGLQNLTNNWQGRTDKRHYETYPDQKLVAETEEKLLSWLAEENPELSADVLSLETDWWDQNGDELFLHYWEGGGPENHEWDEADFIVRVAPEWKIEFFSCIGNG